MPLWWPLLAAVFLLGIFSQIYVLAAMALMLAFVTLLAGYWQAHALERIVYRRRLTYRRGFPGERIPLRLEVENRKFLPLSWLRVDDPLPMLVAPADESQVITTHSPDFGVLVNLYSLRWFERTRRLYDLLLRQRGVYALGPACLKSGDLFGMFGREQEEIGRDFLTVFPEPLSFSELDLPSEDPFGEKRATRRLFEDPNRPVGVRDYRPEDDFRHIHWPATAHTGSLQVRVYQPVSARVMVVCLNVATFRHAWEGSDPPLLEYLIRVTATLAERGLEDGFRVGLISNGCLAHSDQPFRVPPGRSAQQLAHLLTALAGVTPFVTNSFDRFLIGEMPRLPYGATLLVVTAVTFPPLGETLLKLKQHGRKVSLLTFAQQEPPILPGIQVIHRPYIRG